MRPIRLFLLLATTCMTACSAIAPSGSNATSIYAIQHVTIVDVKKGRAIPGQSVIVLNDQIDQIGDEGSVRIPQGATIIDGQGLYLMPGLVDAHVHYYDAPIFGRVLIANGVLLVRDMGNPNVYILPLRDQFNRGETLGPEMIATGTMLDGSPAIIPTISVSLSTPEQGRAAVRAQVKTGVDTIKVYSNLDKEVFLAIVDEARKSRIKVVGHIPDSVYIEDAAGAGLDSIEHWFGFEKVIAKLLGEPVNLDHGWMSAGADYLLRLDEIDPQALQDFYQRLRASRVTVDPTVVVFKNWPNVDALKIESLAHGEYISQELLAMWKSQWAGQTEMPDVLWRNWAQMVKQMNEARIRLMVGTDLVCPGLVPGYSVHEEMMIWQEAGIPPADILRSATLVPVQFMGLQDRLGSIAEGKTASMILVRGNPLEDIQNAQNIEGVFLRGQYFDRHELDQMLSEARDLAKSSNP